MKKKLFAVSSLLIGAVTLFGSVGCATKNVGKITPNETSKTFNVATLDIDSSENTTASVDRNGIILIRTKNYKQDKLKSYTYTLFNLQTNSTVYSLNVDADQDEDEEYSPLLIKTDGFYYSTFTYIDNKTKTEKTEYALYDKTGVAFSELEGDFDGNVFVDNSCNRYYLNMDGKIVKETNPLTIILDLGESEKVGDYYMQGVDDGEVFVFDENGKFLRAVNLLAEMEVPMTAINANGVAWTVGNYAFMQYQQLVPDTEKDYDFLIGLQKYNLITKRYDMKKGGVKDIDIDFLVETNVDAYNDDSIILGGYNIVDKEIMATPIIQSFDKNGDVLTDLQKLAPGADDIAYVSESALVLEAVDTYYVIQKSKVVATFPSEVKFKDDTAILEKNGNLFLYNLDGSQKYSFFNVEDYVSFKGGFILEFEDSIEKYTHATNSIEKMCNMDEDCVAIMVDVNEDTYCDYIYFSDNDGDHNYYSLVSGIDSRLGLDDEENEDMKLASIGYYTIEVDDATTVSGKVYALTEQDPKDDEETVTTYFNCFETKTEEKKGLFNF